VTGSAQRGPHWAVFLGLAAGIVVADQVSKAIVAATLDPGEMVRIVGDLVRIIHGQNTGALFGLFQSSAVLFAAASVVVVGVIVGFHARSGPSLSLSIALGLLLGGALGNLIDRVRLGYVLDFVDMGIGDWRFYTYNIADAAISTAIVALIVLAIWPGLGAAIDRAAGDRAADGSTTPSDPGAPDDPVGPRPQRSGERTTDG